jgi:uncharacterized membrane protein YbhN (UPF0104 family)
MVKTMREFIGLCRSRNGKIAINVASAALGLAVAVLAGRHFAATGWPLDNANFKLVTVAGCFFLLSYAFKVFGWHRLFAPAQRPRRMALAAAGGAAAVGGAALPGRFDDVVRVAVVRRFGASDSCVGTVCLSLFMLGLIDTAALTPLASSAAATSDSSVGVRAGMGLVAAAGLASAIVMSVLPRLVASGRFIRFRVARWLAERTTSPREAWNAWVFVLASWVARAVGLFFLLAALHVTVSFPLAVAFLVAAAASAALPIAPAGAATQAGAGAAILAASGIGTSQAIAFAVAAQATLLAVAAVVLFVAATWGAAQRLRPRLARAAA